MTLSIIIPIYNEERTIEALLEKVRSVPLPENITREIIVVNDGSADNTANVLEKYSRDPLIKVFHKNQNEGKTSAVIVGIKNATGDIILIQDADLEYDPDDYPALIKPIISKEASVVYGSRFKGSIKGMTLINRAANILSNITFNLLFATHLSDMNTCYKVFRKEVIEDIRITSKNFGFDSEITAKVVQKGYHIHEVPINYAARSKKEGKKINWGTACQLYWGIIKHRFHLK